MSTDNRVEKVVKDIKDVMSLIGCNPIYRESSEMDLRYIMDKKIKDKKNKKNKKSKMSRKQNRKRSKK